MLETLLTNPSLALVIVVLALIIAKVLKVAGKAFKAIVCLGLAYVLLNILMSGVV